MKKTPNWYDDWEITTEMPKNDGWIRKVIKLPNSATYKEKIVWVNTDSLYNQVILDLESALYSLTERDSITKLKGKT